jgi:hypothetical protein
MLAGGRHVRQWTHKARMADLFVLFTCGTEPFDAFVRILGDQNAARNATLTKLTCALLLTFHFFVFMEACLTPNVSVA